MKHNLNGKEIAMIESQLKNDLHYLEDDITHAKSRITYWNEDCDVAKKGDCVMFVQFQQMNSWRDTLRKFQSEKKTIVSILTKLKQQKKTQC